MEEIELLDFIYERLVNVHDENVNVDYMLALRELINTKILDHEC